MSDTCDESNDFPKKAAALQLQLIHFGAVSLGEFKSALNWKNTPDFKAPAFTPWAITGGASSRDGDSRVIVVTTAQANSPSPTSSRIEQSETAQSPHERPMFAEPLIQGSEVEASAAETPISTAVSETHSVLAKTTLENITDPNAQEQSLIIPGSTPDMEAAPVSALNLTVKAAVATETRAEIPDTESIDIRSLAAEESLSREPAIQPETYTARTTVLAVSNDGEKVLPPKSADFSSKSNASPSVEPVAPRSSQSNATSKRDSKPSLSKSSPENTRREAEVGKIERPIQRNGTPETVRSETIADVQASRSAPPSRPWPNETTVAVSPAVGNRDDYLIRLEQLIIDLNLQVFALQTGGNRLDESYTRWLESRVVGLGLENLELKREIQELKK